MPRVLLCLVFGLAACTPTPGGPQGDPEALELVERVRAQHGVGTLDHAEVTFSFRGTPFTLRRDGTTFRYARTITDDAGRQLEEVVDNTGARRFVDGVEVDLDEVEADRVMTAVNSVAYFALLPYSLTDPAVRVRALGPDSIGGQAYDRLEATFAQEGGGIDWDDRYVYWLRQPDATMDYLAYSYAVTPGDTSRNETGTRFREVLGVEEVSGVRFQNYRNLTADSIGPRDLERFGDLHDVGQTWTISDILLDSIRVRPL
ncbi:MAG: DUF6503 family protein [Bacteroidota bacterium]